MADDQDGEGYAHDHDVDVFPGHGHGSQRFELRAIHGNAIRTEQRGELDLGNCEVVTHVMSAKDDDPYHKGTRAALRIRGMYFVLGAIFKLAEAGGLLGRLSHICSYSGPGLPTTANDQWIERIVMLSSRPLHARTLGKCSPPRHGTSHHPVFIRHRAMESELIDHTTCCLLFIHARKSSQLPVWFAACTP